jgi:Kef-type K+ transport system membrane component KefB
VLSPRPGLREAVSRRLREFTTAFFLPVFFAYTGLRTNIGSLNEGYLWGICALVFLAAILGKLLGCGLAAKWSGYPWRESIIIGILMNTRALMELIVINAGKDLGVLPDSLFTMFVLMALLTTVMTTPLFFLFNKGTEVEGAKRLSIADR